MWNEVKRATNEMPGGRWADEVERMRSSKLDGIMGEQSWVGGQIERDEGVEDG